MRRAGATYEEIAKAGGGIASTVAATKKASDKELLDQSRRRLHALMAGGCTTVEIKSGYGFDTASELRLLGIAKELGELDDVRIVPTLLALHALPAGADREAFVREATDKLIPEAARRKLATSVDAFCETIAFTPAEVERAFTAARAHGLGVRLHAEQLSQPEGRRDRRQIQGAVGRPSRASRRRRRQGDGPRRHRRRAAPRRLLCAAGSAQAAGAIAARPQGADRHRHRLQPRHLAVAESAAGR